MPTFLALGTGFLGDQDGGEEGEGGLTGGAEGGFGEGWVCFRRNASEGSSSRSFAHRPPLPSCFATRVLRGLPPPAVLGVGAPEAGMQEGLVSVQAPVGCLASRMDAEAAILWSS